MSTVRDLLTDTLQLIGVLDPSETISASVASTCLRRLNAMLNTWSTQGLMVYTLNREVYPLMIGQQDYTLGIGGQIPTVRPVWLNRASIIPTASNPTLEIPLKFDSDEDWQAVSIKSINSTFPLEVHPLGNYPLNTLQFWPIPTAACSVVLYLPQQLGSFATVNDIISFPAAYEEAIVYSLAMRVAPMFGVSVSPDVQRTAMVAIDSVRAQNLVVDRLSVDSSYCGNSGGPSLQAIRSKGFVVD